MSVYWKEDFESGAVSSQTDQIYQTTEYGNPQSDPVGSIVEVVTSTVFKGIRALCFRFAADAPAGGFRACGIKKWNGLDDKSELYFGSAFYVPSSFSVHLTSSSGWANIMQMQENGDPYRYMAALIIVKAPGLAPVFSLYSDYPSGTQHELGGPWTVPLDQWFIVVFGYNGGPSGRIRMWLNKNLVVDSPQNYTDLASVGPGCDVAIYAGGISAGAYIVVDEVTAASTLVLATPVPGPTTQHNLTVTSNPSGLPFMLRRTI